MIRLFDATENQFLTNGDVVLQPLKAVVHKEYDGDYYLNFSCGLEYADYLIMGKIIVVDMPYGTEAFRISGTETTHSKITLKAKHVSYDAVNCIIADVDIVNQDCRSALSQLQAAAEPSWPFEVGSDITDTHSYHCQQKTLYEAVQDVAEIWGGHFLRTNFDLGVWDVATIDSGVTVRYGKNLKNITCERNWGGVVTTLLPIGKDGLMLNALDPTADIYVNSQVQYEIPYSRILRFDQSHINENDYPDMPTYMQALVNDLRAQAEAYLNIYSIPEVNYKIKAHIDQLLDVGYLVEVIDEQIKIELTTMLISFDYDCIAQRYIELEFGTPTPRL